MFNIEVKSFDHESQSYIWKALRPSGGDPYQWKTESKARMVLKSLYEIQHEDRVRVTKVRK